MSTHTRTAYLELRKISLRTVDLPGPGPTEVVVQPHQASVGGTGVGIGLANSSRRRLDDIARVVADESEALDQQSSPKTIVCP